MKRLLNTYPSEVLDKIGRLFRGKRVKVEYSRDHRGRFSKEQVIFYGQMRERLGANKHD